MKDLASNIGVRTVIAPAVATGNTTSSAIDRKGFESLAFVVHSGEIAGDGSFSVKLQESDETGGGTFVDVDEKWLIGELDAPLAASSTGKIGYIGHKRYVRAVLTKASGTSIAVGVIAILGAAHSRPVA